MKNSILVLFGILSTLSLTGAHASSNPKYDFSCECKSGKECDGVEYLGITINKDDTIVATVSNADGEFNESFDLAASEKSVPEKYADNYSRFSVSSNRDYLPTTYSKADLLLKTAMKTGGTRIDGIRRITYTGSAMVITQGGKVKLQYGCKRN